MLQPPFDPSVDLLCHPRLTTLNLSYRFPIFETHTTALCGPSIEIKSSAAVPGFQWFFHAPHQNRQSRGTVTVLWPRPYAGGETCAGEIATNSGRDQGGVLCQ